MMTRTPTKTTRTSTKPARTPTISSRTSTKSSTTATVGPFGIFRPQSPNSTATSPSSAISTREIIFNNSSVLGQESRSFCHPNCTGVFGGIVSGSLLGVALVLLALIAASRLYFGRRKVKADASISNNTHISQSTTYITNVTENNSESNCPPAIVNNRSAIVNNRNTATLVPPQTTHRRRPLVLHSNNEPQSRVSDHIYSHAIMMISPMARQIPDNSTQNPNPSRIYLELINDESDALPPPSSLPTQPSAEEEKHAYYNLGLTSADNIEYEIVDCRTHPTAFSCAFNVHS